MLEAFLFELLQVMLRLFHVIAGIAWIGASFYFIWLDSHLQKPNENLQAKGYGGQLFAVHGGGFYEVFKYRNGPEQIPEPLHWFKWEAYTTWMTGALLLSLLYYVGADIYLLAPDKSDLSRSAAIALAIASIAAVWLVYDGLCRTPLIHRPRLFLLAMLALMALDAWVLGMYLQQRAAIIHVGAAIGTCMAGNVFRCIIPAQRYMVNEVAAGRVPEPTPGLMAKLRSVHNNYATLPIIFIMLGSHFGFVTAKGPLWLLLPVLFVIGLWLRHFFNLRHRGVYRPWVLVSAVLAFVVLVAYLQFPRQLLAQQAEAPAVKVDVTVEQIADTTASVAVESSVGAAENSESPSLLSDVQALELVHQHCAACHSQSPSSPMFTVAPANLQLDNLAQIKQAAPRIYTRAVQVKDMPLGNFTHITDQEREALGQWLKSLP